MDWNSPSPLSFVPRKFLNPPPQSHRSFEDHWSTLDVGGLGVLNVSLTLFRYTFLTQLLLNDNRLLFIPKEISLLKELKVLVLSNNRLTQLPSSLGMCFNLVELLFFDNQISQLPMELGTLYMLETLGMDGNPIVEPIMSLFHKEGTVGVIAFLRDNCPGNIHFN